MDHSIEIIGEIIKDSNIDDNSDDLKVIYENSKNESSSSKLPILNTLTRRPVRTRKPIRKLFEDEEEEDHPKKKRRKIVVSNQSLSEKKKKKSPKRRSKAIVKKSGLSRPLLNMFVKNDNSIQFIGEVKKQTKTPRVEVGGAGTLKYKKKVSQINENGIAFEWDPAKVIAERQSISEWQVRNVVNMFDKENTLPFIARYRKDKTGNLEVEKLREIQNTYSHLKHVQEKVVKVLKDENTAKKIPGDRKVALLRATTLHEVEHLCASLKGSAKRSYAERARELGLSPYAEQIMNGEAKYTQHQDFIYLMNPSNEGLKTTELIEQGIKHIIADVISKEPQVLDYVRDLMRTCHPVLECSQKKKLKSDKSNKSTVGPSEELCNKFHLYFQFTCHAWSLRPHQILAINRGENKSVLSVKINIPASAFSNFNNFCQRKWQNPTVPPYQSHIITKAIEDSYERLVKPFMQRQIRSQLTEMAEIASVEVFTSNLKKLLLTPPLRGNTVLAIDPGFHNGCKIAVTNPQGEMLVTTTIYPFKKKEQLEMVHWSKDHNARTLKEIVNKYGCELFVVGNGTACRQTETYLTNLIKTGCFDPCKVQYTIIDESGISQYSVTPEARKEFPNMDPNHISAVSLARRLQDPLLEYVKVHPMHLGVGMYQHDIPERLLHSSLDSVMTECVSFVGVDINVASEFVLRKLSGLNKTRAANIVEHRKSKGPLINREQLKSVKGIGPRTFEQCAGFITIIPSTLEDEIKKTTSSKKIAAKENICPLDRTMIHPESYEAALKFINIVGLKQEDIGSERFLKNMREFTLKSSVENLSKECGVSIQTMQLIIEGLSLPLDFDIRAKFTKPLFRTGITSINDLCIGTRLTGKVQNMTHFGAFVDIGVGISGLIHTSKMNRMRVELGSVVEVTVHTLEVNRNRIGLLLEKVF